MKTSSVNFNTPSPMESKHRRFALLRKIFESWQWKRRKKRNRFEQTSRTLERKISMRSTKDQLVKKDVLMPVKHNVFLWNLPDVEESLSVPSFLYVSDSPLVSMKKEKREVPLRTADSQAGRLWQPKPSSLRAQAQQIQTKTLGHWRREKAERKRTTEVREQAFPSRIHENLSVRIATF
ncbi:phosphatase and actin regulator 2 [Trichonephila clavipes]|nr:phosphatase and actin regulator 2 [Trichonephila clavipes]